MSSYICDNKKEAMEYRRYLKRTFKTNIVFTETDRDNEVVYIIPFPELLPGRI